MQKLFCDIDNTIVNSTQKFCSCYNQTYKYHPDFVPAQWELVDQWSFKDQCPLITNVEEIFGSRGFFDNLSFINDNTYEVLKQLNEKYKIILVSIGTYNNISFKSQWVGEYLPFIKDSIFLVNNGKMQKSLVNMIGSGNIFIDDVVSNLESVQVERKLCFGTIRQWNRNWAGERVLNWSEVANELL